MPDLHVCAGVSPRSRRLLAAGLFVAIALVACGQGDKKAEAPAQAAGGMPAPEVGVVVATPGDIGLVTELPGRL